VRRELISYPELARLTDALTADPRWPGPTVRVLPLRDRRYWGRAWTRTVRYAPIAPVWVVPHELAHIASGDLGHGPEWRAWMVRLTEELEEMSGARRKPAAVEGSWYP
jgi:hypothetical protein